MKHGKLGIKELHTGRNVSVLLYSGLISNARVVHKATPVREWLATESILGKPETRKDIFKTELNATLAVDDIDLLVPESDLRDRIQIFTTKEKAIKWARRFGRETKAISGSELLEVLNPHPIIRKESRRITDEFGAKGIVRETRLDNGEFGAKGIVRESSRITDGYGAKGIVKESASRLQMVGRTPLQTIKEVVSHTKFVVKGHGDMVYGTAPGTPLRKYLYLTLIEVIHLNALTHLEFKYDRDADEIETLACISSDGVELANQDAVKEMLHVICTDYLDDVHVQITLKDGNIDLGIED